MGGPATPAATDAGEAPASPAPALEARGLTKRFGAVTACAAVDLRARRGEIHGILGQNGAGKTTLMNMLLGLVTPDAGQILVHGRPVAVRDPIAAAGLGLAMVHQHFSLIGPLTVWENITLGVEGGVDKRRTIRTIDEVAARYGLDVDAAARVDDLTTGQRQRVEILKCLMRDPDVFILDEPTSVLTAQESLDLFRVLRQVVQDEHRAVLLISHKLDEVLFATDTVTIMRNGAVVARLRTEATDANELAREMIGHDVSLRSMAAALGHIEELEREVEAEHARSTEVASSTGAPGDAPVVLAIRDARVDARDGRRLLDGLSIEVRRGEILGLAGVEGNGQKAIGDVLASLLPLAEGTVEVAGRPVRPGAGAMARAGVGVIPEDRHVSGVVLDMSVMENLLLDNYRAVCRRGFVHRRRRAPSHKTWCASSTS